MGPMSIHWVYTRWYSAISRATPTISMRTTFVFAVSMNSSLVRMRTEGAESDPRPFIPRGTPLRALPGKWGRNALQHFKGKK